MSDDADDDVLMAFSPFDGRYHRVQTLGPSYATATGQYSYTGGPSTQSAQMSNAYWQQRQAQLNAALYREELAQAQQGMAMASANPLSQLLGPLGGLGQAQGPQQRSMYQHELLALNSIREKLAVEKAKLQVQRDRNGMPYRTARELMGLKPKPNVEDKSHLTTFVDDLHRKIHCGDVNLSLKNSPLFGEPYFGRWCRWDTTFPGTRWWKRMELKLLRATR